MFEKAVVNEPSVFESLKFYCRKKKESFVMADHNELTWLIWNG